MKSEYFSPQTKFELWPKAVTFVFTSTLTLHDHDYKLVGIVQAYFRLTKPWKNVKFTKENTGNGLNAIFMKTRV